MWTVEYYLQVSLGGWLPSKPVIKGSIENTCNFLQYAATFTAWPDVTGPVTIRAPTNVLHGRHGGVRAEPTNVELASSSDDEDELVYHSADEGS